MTEEQVATLYPGTETHEPDWPAVNPAPCTKLRLFDVVLCKDGVRRSGAQLANQFPTAILAHSTRFSPAVLRIARKYAG